MQPKITTTIIILFFMMVVTVTTGTCQELKILAVTPTGELENIDQAQTIQVTFNQPMVPLEALPQGDGTGPLQLVPPIAGKFRWLGTTVLELTPAERFQFATLYQVRISAGTASVSGKKLTSPYEWTFTTPRPGIVRHYPEQNAKNQKLRPHIELYFNQPMSLDLVTSYIKLIERSSGRRIPVTIVELGLGQHLRIYPRFGLEHGFAITPTEELPMGQWFSLKVEVGLLGKEGPVPMNRAFELSFMTYPKFAFSGLVDNEKLNPNNGIQLLFSNPVRMEYLIKCISFKPAIKDLQDIYGYYDHHKGVFHLGIYMVPDTTYTCTISKDLPDEFGNTLGYSSEFSFTTGPYPARARFNIAEGVLEAYGDRRFPANFLNQNLVKLKMGILPEERLIPLLRHHEAFLTDRSFNDTFFTLDKDWQITGRRNKRMVLPIEANWILEGKPYGLILMQMHKIDPPAEEPEYYKSLLQVTDLGITAKFSAMNNLVWVTNLKDATPVAEAQVEIRDDNNKVFWIGYTNADGLVETPGWKKLGITGQWDQYRQWVFVRKGDDFAYTASDRGTGIEPYRFGISYKWDPEPSKTMGILFTERGIYRAGDTVHLKGIFRYRPFEEWQVWARKNIRLRIVDAKKEKLVQSDIKLSVMGSFSYDLMLKDDAPLGYYWASAETLQVNDSDTNFISLASCSFQVEDYKPAEFEVEVRPDKKEYINGDTLRANITARYLFGAPMQNAPVSWRVYLGNDYFEPEGYHGYFFGPTYRYYGRASRYDMRRIAAREDSLNQYGNLSIQVPIRIPDLLSIGNLVIEGETTSPARQQLAGRRAVQLHPGEFYIGIKPKSTFINVKKPLEYSIITISPQGKPMIQKNVVIEIYRQVWHSVRKAGIDGRYQWRSQVVDRIQDSLEVKTGIEPSIRSFQPDSSGFYQIKASSVDARGNQIISKAYFYVTGSGYVPWERSDDDRIELIADANRYKPGDVAQVMVKSPFETATALVTVEREGILSRFTAQLVGSAPKIEIPILENYLPNVFVGVVLLQGRIGDYMFSEEGEDIGRPAFKVGYINLPVVTKSRHLNVNVTTVKTQYQPGENVTVDLALQDAAGKPVRGEITLAAVDVGVLNLIGYKMPDPLDAFYGPRQLAVRTSETRLHVVEQRNYGEKGENRGGGGGISMAGVDLRRKFIATAHWLPAIQTDGTGQARVSFDLPDNLTTFRIMAVAHTINSYFGYGSTDIQVNKPLLLQASLPRFARYGDSFEAGVVVHNFSGRDGTVNLNAEVEGLQLTGAPDQAFSIADGKANEIRFPFKVDRLGTAIFRFRARMGEWSDGLEITIPLQIHRVQETVANFQSTEEKKVEEKITLPGDALPDLGEIEFTVAATAMTGLRSGLDYLFHYPYGCLEQRLACILPMIQAGELIDAFNLPALKNGEYRQAVQHTLDRLPKYQRPDGGFGYWQDSYYSWPYLSAFAVYTLLQAKAKGYQVDATCFNKAIPYLKEALRQEAESRFPYGRSTELVIKPFILYDLALLGEPEYGYLALMFDQRHQMPIEGRVFLLKAMHLVSNQKAQVTTLLEELNNNLKIDPTTAYFDEPWHQDLVWIYYSNLRTTAMLLQAMLEIKGDYPLAERMVRWILAQRKVGRWCNTQDNCYALSALTSYFNKFEAIEPDFTTELKLAGKKVLEATFAGRSFETIRQQAKLDDFTRGKPLDFDIKKNGQGRLYYGTWMTYFPVQPLPSRSAGITVTKIVRPTTRDLANSGKFRPGELVLVALKFQLPHDRHFIMVDDPLPAGFEAVNIRLKTESLEHERTLEKERNKLFRWHGFNHVEMHDDRVLLFADYLTAGEYEYQYLARATTYGQFTMPPTHVEEMYTPEVFGRCEGRMVKIEEGE